MNPVSSYTGIVLLGSAMLRVRSVNDDNIADCNQEYYRLVHKLFSLTENVIQETFPLYDS
jgi:hypothetical protein